MGRRTTDGKIEDKCLERVRPGEPFFVLRAQDKLAPLLIELWADMARANGLPIKKYREAMSRASEMRQWRPRKFPD